MCMCVCVCVYVVCTYALLVTEAKRGHWIPLPLMQVLEAKFESPERVTSVLKCQALFSTLLSLYSQTASPLSPMTFFKTSFIYVCMHVEVYVCMLVLVCMCMFVCRLKDSLRWYAWTLLSFILFFSFFFF